MSIDAVVTIARFPGEESAVFQPEELGDVLSIDFKIGNIAIQKLIDCNLCMFGGNKTSLVNLCFSGLKFFPGFRLCFPSGFLMNLPIH